MEDRLLTTDEVVRYLKIPKSTLYKLSEKKELPSLKIGKQLRFRKASLDLWLEQKETKSFGKSSLSKEILIIDDDRLILRSIVKFLKSLGYRAEPAESGEEALEKIKNSRCPYYVYYLSLLSLLLCLLSVPIISNISR